MMRRYNRLLVAFFVVSDLLLGMTAFLVAYLLRFELLGGLLPDHTRASRRSAQYLRMAPFIGLLVPIAFQVQGLYRLRRGRSRVDDFFGVFVGTILAVVLGLGGTLYYQTYYVAEPAEGRRPLRSLAVGLAAVPGRSTCRSPTPRASWCAKRSSAAGAPASA